MKLASLKDGRDGRLLLVSRDMKRACFAGEDVQTMQNALDDWANKAPVLEERAKALENGGLKDFPFLPGNCAAPLPRAYDWIDASAYTSHGELMQLSMGQQPSAKADPFPLMYQGAGDDLLGPHDDIVLADQAWGIDFEAELGVILDDVPMGTLAGAAAPHVKLLTLINDISLRNLQPREMANGFGMLQSKPATAFAAIAITPDEAGDAWDGRQLSITMTSTLRGEAFGRPSSGSGMRFKFDELIAHAAKTRRLGAGTILGSGTVSNAQPVERARIDQGGVGFSCISELRAIEKILSGKGQCPFMASGDRIRIEARDVRENSLFGAIDQSVRIVARH